MRKLTSGIAGGNAEAVRTCTKRSDSLDVMKCLAAFFVVLIHFGPGLLSPFSRTAVPVFFIISGFYYPVMIRDGNFWRHIRKLVIMCVLSSTLYGICSFLKAWQHDSVDTWADSMFGLRHIAFCVITDRDLFGFHLWYFYAVIYDLIVFYMADKLRLTRHLKYMTFALLLIFLASNFTCWYSLTRNFLFFGLPCMMTGRMIREGRDKHFSFIGKRKYLPAVVCISLMLCYAELWYHGVREMFVFTIPLILPFFYHALRNPELGKGSLPALIGRRYSAFIYIFHIIVFKTMQKFIPLIIPDNKVIKAITLPILVFGLSLLTSYVFVKVNEWMCASINAVRRPHKKHHSGTSA